MRLRQIAWAVLSPLAPTIGSPGRSRSAHSPVSCSSYNTTIAASFVRASSLNCLLVGNSLIDNGQNGYDGGENNHWDDGEQGNYWSDHDGVDADGDGTGDTAYPIPRNGEDQYPITTPPQPP